MEKAARGFAAMDPELQRSLAAKGGRRAHELGKGHKFKLGDSKASEAAKRGQAKLRASLGEEGYSLHMSKIGRRGGAARKEVTGVGSASQS